MDNTSKEAKKKKMLYMPIPKLVCIMAIPTVISKLITILNYASSYGTYILISAPIMCLAFVINNLLRSEGAVLFSMCGLCTGGIINVILDPILIFYCDLGVAGAAIATMLSQFMSFFVLSSFYLMKKSVISLRIKYISKNYNSWS